MRGHLCIRLLGGFRISVGPRTIEESEWRLKKAGRLVKLLSLAPQHRLHRERIMNLLWPNLGTKAAVNNLCYTLHNARQVLEPERKTKASRYLIFQDELLKLCPEDPVWVDVEAFEEAADIASRSRDPATYRAALDLYTGEFLPEDYYEEWTQGRREELRRTYLDLLLEMAELHEESEEFGLAREALRLVVAADPTHEKAHTRLMRLYALSGQHQVALGQYERLRKALSREFGTEPSDANRQLYEEVLAGKFPPATGPPIHLPREEPAATSRHDLPAARTAFVGRKDELVGIRRALAMTRLLTLIGACGSGKTRLALQVAGNLAGAYPDGVWLAELATLSEGALVPQVVATALGVHERPGRPITDALVDVLRRKKTLLVLDNCEHLIDAAAHLVDTLLSYCPHLQILATSREALGVAGEVRWSVMPLSLPDPRQPPTVENVARAESVQLFLERARHPRPSFSLTSQNAGAVADICRQLEGIPLAMELAAARVAVLSVEQIAARLEGSLKLLTAGSRTAPPRQQTLRGALDWSYSLLAEPERILFRRLSVFAGSWSLQAAEAVGAGGGIGEDNVLDLLSRLVDKSLVLAEAGPGGALRYRLMEPIRQYGWERLEASGEAESVRRRHAAWFLELAEEAEPELRGARQGAWLERLEREHTNLRAALSCALESEEAESGLRLSAALGEYWYMRGDLDEGRRWLEAALARGAALSSSTRVKGLIRMGYIVWEQGDYERSTTLSEEGLALARELGDAAGAAAALSNLAWSQLYRNELGQASTLAGEAVTLQRTSGDTAGFARTLLILGMVAAVKHDCQRATALHEESLALARKVQDNFTTILALALGAFVSLGLGDYGRVRTLCAEGLKLSLRLKMRCLTAAHLHISAALAGSRGWPVRSARLWGAAEALREDMGATFSPVEHHAYRPYIAAARTQLDEVAWETAWTEGRTMTLEVAVEYACSEEEQASTTTPASKKPPLGGQLDKLTRREREVAMLIGRGLTPDQISVELTISKRTVDHHIYKIFKRLGLRSQAQIAVCAAEQQPVPSD